MGSAGMPSGTPQQRLPVLPQELLKQFSPCDSPPKPMGDSHQNKAVCATCFMLELSTTCARPERDYRGMDSENRVPAPLTDLTSRECPGSDSRHWVTDDIPSPSPIPIVSGRPVVARQPYSKALRSSSWDIPIPLSMTSKRRFPQSSRTATRTPALYPFSRDLYLIALPPKFISMCNAMLAILEQILKLDLPTNVL